MNGHVRHAWHVRFLVWLLNRVAAEKPSRYSWWFEPFHIHLYAPTYMPSREMDHDDLNGWDALRPMEVVQLELWKQIYAKELDPAGRTDCGLIGATDSFSSAVRFIIRAMDMKQCPYCRGWYAPYKGRKVIPVGQHLSDWTQWECVCEEVIHEPV